MMRELTPREARKVRDEIREEVTPDFIAAHDREPRDDRELAEWCRAQTEKIRREEPMPDAGRVG